MKKFFKTIAFAFAVVFTSIGLAACGCTNTVTQSDVEGTWKVESVIDGEETYTRAEYEALVAKPNKTTKEEMTVSFVGMFFIIEIRLTNDGKVYQKVSDEEQEVGTYSVKDGKITLNLDGQEESTAKYENGKLIVTMSDSPTLTFKKA